MRIDYLEDVQKITKLASKMETRINNLEHALIVILENLEQIENGEVANKVASIAADALAHIGVYEVR